MDISTLDPVDLVICLGYAFGSSMVLAVLLVYCIICNISDVEKKIKDLSQKYSDLMTLVNARAFLNSSISF